MADVRPNYKYLGVMQLLNAAKMHDSDEWLL